MCDLWAICGFWFGRKSVCLQSPSSQTRHRRYLHSFGTHCSVGALLFTKPCSTEQSWKVKKKKNSGINALLCMGSQRAMKCAPMEKSLVHAQSLGGSICSEGRWPSNSTKQHWPQFYSLNVWLFLPLLNGGDRSPPPVSYDALRSGAQDTSVAHWRLLVHSTCANWALPARTTKSGTRGNQRWMRQRGPETFQIAIQHWNNSYGRMSQQIPVHVSWLKNKNAFSGVN